MFTHLDIGRRLDMDLRSLAAFRVALACALIYELSDRVFSTNTLEGFYSEQGIWPARLMQDHSTPLHVWLSPHSWYDGSLTAALLVMQFGAALCLLLGWQTRLAALLSWLLYNSLTLRNVWLSYIADRYFHILLFYAALLPCGRRFSLDRALSKRGLDDSSSDDQAAGLPGASLLFKLQILWIYLDAGWGKLTDPLQGWSFGATPLPALDTYTRHTYFAVWLYRALGPLGLRLMTPTVVAAELLAPAAVLLASAVAAPLPVQLGLIFVLPLMHLGISLALVNTVSLSIIASVAWLPFVPGSGWGRASSHSQQVGAAAKGTVPITAAGRSIWPSACMLAFVALCAHHELRVGSACTQAGLSTVSSVLLNNRWNVFVGADGYVTWEICPAKLADGRVVDLWTRGGPVSWDVPSLSLVNHSASTPGTLAFARRSGRWRSFPYLSVAEGGEGGAMLDGPGAGNAGEEFARQDSCRAESLSWAAARPLDAQFHRRVWTYLCTEWNGRQPPSARVLRYSFFMLQADIEPGLAYSAVRKRLIHSHECLQPTPGEAVFEDGN